MIETGDTDISDDSKGITFSLTCVKIVKEEWGKPHTGDGDACVGAHRWSFIRTPAQ